MVDRGWVFNRPNVFTWAAVRLDSNTTQLQLVNPAHIQEATMNEDPGTTVVDPDIPFVTEDPPADDADDSTDDDSSTDQEQDEPTPVDEP